MNRKKLKRVFILAISVFAILVVLYLLLVFIQYLLNLGDTLYILETSYQADYSSDILEDPYYLSKDRSVYYLEYGTGEVLTSENFDDAPASAKFFYQYFECIISGEYTKLSSFYTEEYRNSNFIPEKFTMQKIYDIKVNLYNRNRGDNLETFIVSYKIMENNGTFRPDVPSDTSIPLAFELHSNSGIITINAIKGIETIYD